MSKKVLFTLEKYYPYHPCYGGGMLQIEIFEHPDGFTASFSLDSKKAVAVKRDITERKRGTVKHYSADTALWNVLRVLLTYTFDMPVQMSVDVERLYHYADVTVNGLKL